MASKLGAVLRHRPMDGRHGLELSRAQEGVLVEGGRQLPKNSRSM
ncbi:hypothetical protein [Pseudorhodoferax sp.]